MISPRRNLNSLPLPALNSTSAARAVFLPGQLPRRRSPWCRDRRGPAISESNWRGTQGNDRLDAESRRKRSAHANKPERPNAAPSSNAPARARRRCPGTSPSPKAPVSAAFVAAKEKAVRAARDIRRKYAEGLAREEYIRLANAFRSAVVPRRKPGRRTIPAITAAYADWKAGMRGADLYRKHIPGWAGHNRYHRIGEQKELMDAIRSRRRRDRALQDECRAHNGRAITRFETSHQGNLPIAARDQI